MPMCALSRHSNEVGQNSLILTRSAKGNLSTPSSSFSSESEECKRYSSKKGRRLSGLWALKRAGGDGVIFFFPKHICRVWWSCLFIYCVFFDLTWTSRIACCCCRFRKQVHAQFSASSQCCEKRSTAFRMTDPKAKFRSVRSCCYCCYCSRQ